MLLCELFPSALVSSPTLENTVNFTPAQEVPSRSVTLIRFIVALILLSVLFPMQIASDGLTV